MIEVRKIANVWMVVRSNSEGIVSVIKSCATEAGAKRVAARVA